MLREAFAAAGSSSSKSGEPSVPVLASKKAFESLVRAKQALFSLSLFLSHSSLLALDRIIGPDHPLLPALQRRDRLFLEVERRQCRGLVDVDKQIELRG